MARVLYFISLMTLIVAANVQSRGIEEQNSPQNCEWSPWVDRGCSATCGEHVKRTKIRIKLQEASNGGKRCRGATKRILPCDLPECENQIIPDDFSYPDDLGNFQKLRTPFLLRDEELKRVECIFCDLCFDKLKIV